MGRENLKCGKAKKEKRGSFFNQNRNGCEATDRLANHKERKGDWFTKSFIFVLSELFVVFSSASGLLSQRCQGGLEGFEFVAPAGVALAVFLQNGCGDFFHEGGIGELGIHLGEFGLNLGDLDGHSLFLSLQIDQTFQGKVDGAKVGDDAGGAGRSGLSRAEASHLGGAGQGCEDDLLGSQPDEEIARLLGRAPDAVRKRRISLGVPFSERPAGGRHWTMAEELLVGNPTGPRGGAATGPQPSFRNKEAAEPRTTPSWRFSPAGFAPADCVEAPGVHAGAVPVPERAVAEGPDQPGDRRLAGHVADKLGFLPPQG